MLRTDGRQGLGREAATNDLRSLVAGGLMERLNLVLGGNQRTHSAVPAGTRNRVWHVAGHVILPNSRIKTDINQRPPLPPFIEKTARQKVQAAEEAWNTRDPERVALAYTQDTEWRNRAEFLHGRAQVIEFLRRKWNRELHYRLKKTLWALTGNRIAVRFEYEFHDDSGHWYRAYGNEN